MVEFLVSTASRSVNMLLGWFFDIFTEFMQLDLATIVNQFPFLYVGYQIFTTLAIGLAVVIGMVQIARFFSGSQSVQEAPHMTLLRVGITIPLIRYSGTIINWLVSIAKVPFDAIIGASKVVVVQSISLATSAQEVIAHYTTSGMSTLALSLLGLILVAAIGWNVIKLVVEICERYFMVAVVAYVSPLTICTLSSGATSTIFSKWFGMFIGQLIIMTLSIWSYNLVSSGLAVLGKVDNANMFVHLLMILAACRVGMRIDTYMQQLGIGVGTTGGGLFDEAMGAFHTLSGFAKGLKKGGGGSEAGATGKSSGVLGGHVDSDGKVRPNPAGFGILGAARTAGRYAMSEIKQGGSLKDVMDAAGKGAWAGLGIGKNADGTRDLSALIGRRANNKLNEIRGARQEALAEKAKGAASYNDLGGFGSVVQSPNGEKHLDQAAKDQGLKVGRDGALVGSTDAAAGFAATNFGKVAAADTLSSTFAHGSPEVAEQMFSKGDDFGYDAAKHDVGQASYDKLGSDALTSMMSSGFDSLEKSAPFGPQTEAMANATAVGSIMRSTMEGKDGAHLSGFKAGYVGGKAENGWAAAADIADKDGKKIGSMQMLDQTAFGKLNEKDQTGYIPMQSATGQDYYMKATSEKGQSLSSAANAMQAQAAGGTDGNPQKPVEEGSYFKADMGDDHPQSTGLHGVQFESDGHAYRITGDDSAFIGGAIVEGLNSSRMKANDIAHYTITGPKSGADADIPYTEAFEAALYDKEAGAINPGKDSSVASLMQAVHADDLSNLVRQAEGVSAMSADAVSQFNDAMAHAAAGQPSDSGYSVDGFVKSADGVVSCDYHTPEGDFQVQSKYTDGGFQFSVTPQETRSDGQVAAALQASASGGGEDVFSQPGAGKYDAAGIPAYEKRNKKGKGKNRH